VIPIPSGKLLSSTAKKLPDVIPISTVLKKLSDIKLFLTKIIKLRKELLTQLPTKYMP